MTEYPIETEVKASLLEETILQALENQNCLRDILADEVGAKASDIVVHDRRLETNSYGDVSVVANVEVI